jgi:outer membrane protein
MTSKLISAVVLAAATLASGATWAQASDGPWLIRLRAVDLQSSNSDSTGLNLAVNNKTIPEVDFTYFFNKNMAAELILTVPQEHNLTSGGSKIGTVTHLPPTLLAQYHFDGSGFRPYVGLGVNYTRFTTVDLPAGVDVKRDSFGGALQIGVDIPLSGNMFLNFDVKKVYLETEVSAGGKALGKFKVDPLLVGLGIGWRF